MSQSQVCHTHRADKYMNEDTPAWTSQLLFCHFVGDQKEGKTCEGLCQWLNDIIKVYIIVERW